MYALIFELAHEHSNRHVCSLSPSGVAVERYTEHQFGQNINTHRIRHTNVDGLWKLIARQMCVSTVLRAMVVVAVDLIIIVNITISIIVFASHCADIVDVVDVLAVVVVVIVVCQTA